MTARPILFSAPMVRALLDGRKTQTRRALKQQPLDILPLQKEKRGREWVSLEQPEPHGRVVRCRFGMPGDVLWVRETWGEYIQDIGDARQDRWYVYRADGKERPSDNGSDVPWTPSIHMPRRVSRITLRISDVRVERLQAISEADAIAKAHLPVDGLGFGDGFITLGGVSWAEASEAERIDAATAIQMALNPKLRVILIRHASGVGSQIREQIRERAAKFGYRVLMEVLDESGANSHVFIEDGLVKLIDGKEPPAPQPDPQPEPAAVTDDGPNKLDDEFALSPEPPTKQKPVRRQWKGPGAATGDQS